MSTCQTCGAPRQSQAGAAISVGRRQMTNEFIALLVSNYALVTAVVGWPRTAIVVPFGSLALAAYAARIKLEDLHLRDSNFTLSVGRSGVVYFPPRLMESRGCVLAQTVSEHCNYRRGGRLRFA